MVVSFMSKLQAEIERLTDKYLIILTLPPQESMWVNISGMIWGAVGRRGAGNDTNAILTGYDFLSA